MVCFVKVISKIHLINRKPARLQMAHWKHRVRLAIIFSRKLIYLLTKKIKRLFWLGSAAAHEMFGIVASGETENTVYDELTQDGSNYRQPDQLGDSGCCL